MALKAGVIGCGNISKFHFSGIERSGSEVKWVCDIVPENADQWGKKFNAEFTSDYKDIIADKDVDVVVLTLVSSLHKQMCFDAINAGKAVICEKTLTDNAKDSLEIVKLAEKKKTIFYTSYMKRFIPAVEKAKALLPSLGEIMSTHIRTYQQWGDLWRVNPSEGFFHTPVSGKSTVVKNYGGGILVCGGSHLLDLILYFLGRPNKLFASIYTPEGRDYELQASALMETNNGMVHFEALAHPLSKIGFLKDGWDERIEISGTNGRIEIYSAKWDEVESKASVLIHYDNKTGQLTEYHYDSISPFDCAAEFFYKNIEKGQQGSQSRLTGYEVDELIEHMNKSSDSGQAVDINWQI